MTHVATAHAVEHCGARPVFADVSPSTGNIDPACLEAAITPQTKAIVVVHYLGLPCDMEVISGIAEARNLVVIEDCALAIGGAYAGRHSGSLGHVGCFSFYPSKHMTTLEGGMLVTDDTALADFARRNRAFGYDRGAAERSVPDLYDVSSLGFNYRMSEAHAAVGLCQLDRLDGFIAKRRENSNALLECLGTIDCAMVFPALSGSAESGRFCVNLTLHDEGIISRNDLVRRLGAASIGTSIHYPVALPMSAFYREKYVCDESEFPVSTWIAAHTISLPCGPHLGLEEMEYISDSVAALLT